nr:EpsD family peptidyl-prolyl cis-trans isomerase [uncultured Duganella sp.]
MSHYDSAIATQPAAPAAAPFYRAALGLALVAGLAACGGKADKGAGQALARVDGAEITVLQLNDELQRANVPAARQQEGSKQLLEALIDRQLVLAAADKDKLDRDPKVLQAIERARALVVAQAYMQKRIGAPAKPGADEVKAYYDQHPEFFSARKQLDMRQLVLATKDIDDGFTKVVDGAKTLDEVAVWLDGHRVAYGRAQVARTTAELPAEMGQRILALPRGQLFIVREGERSVLTQVVDIKDAPATLAAATPQIEQFLAATRAKQAAAAEVARLRAAAKIDYLNKSLAPGATPAAPAAAPAAPAAEADAIARGVSSLR